MKIWGTLLIVVLLAAVFFRMMETQKTSLSELQTVRYIPIGDSYTIGEGVSEEESFPSQLAKKLNEGNIPAELVDNPAVSGFTTQDAVEKEIVRFQQGTPTFSTLLIGANDWVRGVDTNTFRKNLVTLIESMQKTLPKKENLILVTIPDFSVTPVGIQFGKDANIIKGITEYNNIIKEEGKKRNLKVVDIFPISQNLSTNPKYLAADGLHPSGEQYKEWVELLYPVAFDMLTETEN